MSYTWGIKPENLTPRFLAALLKWQSQSERSVKIDISRVCGEEDSHVSIWCYDHRAAEGRHVSKITEIPTTQQLLEMKQDSINKQRAELEKRLNDLEGKK